MFLVSAKINNAVGDDDVSPIVLDGYLFEQPFAKFDIFKCHISRRLARLIQHLLCHIDTDNHTVRADLIGRHKAIEPTTGSDVNDTFTLLQRAK